MRTTLVLLLVALATTTHAEDRDALCRAGIIRAKEGRLASAESLFVAMLSTARHDPRALNNLGNVELLRGHPGAALAYYAQAQKCDSLDAGIRLNRALALTALGEDARGRAELGTATAMAGGVDSARSRLGLRPDAGAPKSPPSAAATSRDTRAQLRALLKKAIGPVPPDSTHAPPGVESNKNNQLITMTASTRSGARTHGDNLRLYWRERP